MIRGGEDRFDVPNLNRRRASHCLRVTDIDFPRTAASDGVDGSKDAPAAIDRERIASRRFIVMPSMKPDCKTALSLPHPKLWRSPWQTHLLLATLRRRHVADDLQGTRMLQRRYEITAQQFSP